MPMVVMSIVDLTRVSSLQAGLLHAAAVESLVVFLDVVLAPWR